MADLKARPRPTGAKAVLGRTGFPHVTSATKGEIDIVTSPSQPGFNPLDLLYSSLSACLVLSARIAASNLGILDKITEITADVTGEKAPEGLSRVQKFNIDFSIKGDIDDETRQKIAHLAEEEICTVSNTIRGNPEFSSVVTG
ncbi:OsmC family protein [Rhizobium sp. 21-4511-3d]